MSEKETAIKELEKFKAEVTETRVQSREKAQPAVAFDPTAAALVKQADRLHKGRDIKAKIDEAIAWIRDPQPNHKLEKEKRYRPGKSKSISPCFIPEWGFQQMEETDAERFADRFAAEGWGNTFRMFVLGNWEPKKKITLPYNKRSDGKFELTTKNLLHFDRLWRRGDYFVERYVMPIISLQDNCSLKYRVPGHWNTHPFNGDNNVNGTANEPYSMTHHYEYDGTHPEHAERPGMKETRYFCFDLFEYALLGAKEHWGDFFGIEILNEGDAKNDYHVMLHDFIVETLKQGDLKGRLFTSMAHDEFYASHTINKLCMPIIHKVGDFDEYHVRKEIMLDGQQFGTSQDGRPPIATAKETKEYALKILYSPALSCEGNLRPIEWPKICGGTWKLNDFKFELFSAYGKAFDEYLS